eukprot:492104_1
MMSTGAIVHFFKLSLICFCILTIQYLSPLSYFSSNEALATTKNYNIIDSTLIKVNFSLQNQQYKDHKFVMLKDSNHKLTYCPIAKNANTLFKNLFYTIFKNNTMMFKRTGFGNLFLRFNGSNDSDILVGSQDEYYNILNDTKWQKLVILRDPVERFLSAFLNKCYKKKKNKQCNDGGKTSNFTLFAERMFDRLKNHNGIGINHHFMPQHLFCDLYKTYKYYNHVIVYNFDSIGNDTLHFLKLMNLSEYYNYWGTYKNETMFIKPTHPTYNVSTNKSSFYKQWFKTKKFAMQCIEMFQTDYVLFNLSAPEWINVLD